MVTRALFVGDKPSKKNLDPDVAFVGADCHARLLDWVRRLKVQAPEFVNRTHSEFSMWIHHARAFKIPIIALGEEASKALGFIEHFKLPHPSGLNRKINDKKFVSDQLRRARKFINLHNI